MFSPRNLAETPGTEISADSEVPGLGVRALVTRPIENVWRSATWSANGAINLRVALPAATPVRLIVLAAPRDGVVPPAGCSVRVTGSVVAVDGAEALNTGAIAFGMAPHGLWAILLPAAVTVRWLRLRFLAATEPPITNLIRNPTFAGGTASVLPTYMSWTSTTNQTASFTYGTEFDMPFMEVTLATTAATGSRGLNLEQAGAIPLIGSATYTGSIYARLIGGSFSGWTTLGLRRITNTATSANGASVNMLGVTSALERFPIAETVAANAATGTMQLLYSAPNAASVVFRLYGPQFELGSAPGAPYLASTPPNPGYLQLGRLWLDNPVVTERAVSYGMAPGGLDTGTLDRAPLSGTPYARHGVVLRKLNMPLALLAEAEGEALHRATMEAGTTRQVFAAPFASTPGEGMLGSLTEVPDAPLVSFRRRGMTLNLVEDR